MCVWTVRLGKIFNRYVCVSVDVLFQDITSSPAADVRAERDDCEQHGPGGQPGRRRPHQQQQPHLRHHGARAPGAGHQAGDHGRAQLRQDPAPPLQREVGDHQALLAAADREGEDSLHPQVGFDIDTQYSELFPNNATTLYESIK